MKNISIFILLPILFISCSTTKEAPLPEPIPEPEVVFSEIEESTPQPTIEIEDSVITFDINEIDKSIYFSTPISISNRNISVPAVLQGELFIEEFFPEDKILRLIALKKRYYSFNELSEGGFEENEVTAIFSEDGDYYLGTRRGGVLRYNIESGLSSIIKLPDNTLYNRSITGILSYNDTIYISSYAGLFSYNPQTERIDHISGDLSNRGIVSMCKIGNEIFLGTVKGFLYSWNMKKFRLLASTGSSSVSLISSTNNHIVVGLSGRGIFLYDQEAGVLQSIDDINDDLTDKQVNAVAYFDGSYYVGTRSDGLLVYNTALEMQNEKTQETTVLTIAMSDKRIYFGTHRDGLLIYDSIKETWNNWGFREGLSSIYVPSVFFDINNIFISIPDKGIVIINEEIHEKQL